MALVDFEASAGFIGGNGYSSSSSVYGQSTTQSMNVGLETLGVYGNGLSYTNIHGKGKDYDYLVKIIRW